MPAYKPPKPPPGCSDLEAHERSLCELAAKLESRSQSLLDSDGRIDAATGNQLALAAIRARQQAALLAKAREDQHHLTWLVDENRALDGLPRHLQDEDDA